MIRELGENSGTSPLKERLSHLAIILSKIGYFCAILVSLSYLFNKIVISNSFNITKIWQTLNNFSLLFAYILHALTLSVTIIVVSVPEGLPMMVTLVLSSNMKKMLKNNVLVRKMVGIETAGSLNILFTDKTGTLTKGKLEVIRIMLGNQKQYSNIRQIRGFYQRKLIDSLIYNNESSYDKETNKIIGGNITDKAILNFIKVNRSSSVNIIEEKLFNSKNKYSMVITEEKGIYTSYYKGATEIILPLCDRYLNEEGNKKLILHKEELEKKLEKITNSGIRLICIAYKEGNNNTMNNLILLGFLFIKDEIREESINSVKRIEESGIQIVMVTGDNKNTAESIAKEVKILKTKEDIILTSKELEKLSDEDVDKLLPNLRVVARAMPNDKSRLVNIAKRKNLVVGMTGDGVNDSLALKTADVGFSMGSGTEVAKEASDIVILDDNISSIGQAILYGRTIFKSIRKFIIFQLTVNLCAISISVIGPFIGIQSPVTVIQMLWINMVMDTLAGLAFSYEPALEEYMQEPPKKRNEPIINKYMFQEILITGIYSSFLCIFFLKSNVIKSFYRYSYNEQYLMTAFFGLFIFISIFNSFNARTIRLNILQDIWKNKMFLIIISLVAIIQIAMIYYGGSLFRTTGLTIKEFIIMLLISLTVIPFDIIRKIIFKRNNKNINV